MTTPKRKEVTTVSFEKLSLFKELPNGRKAKLSWGIRGMYPRITVFTNTKETDSVYENLIIAPMNGEMFYTILTIMRRSIVLKDNTVISIDCMNKKWVDNLPTDEVYVQATINIRYTVEGFIELSLTAEDKDEVVFTVGEHAWHILKDNSSLSSVEFAEIVTSGYIRELENVFTKVYVNKQTDAIKTYGGGENKNPETKKEINTISGVLSKQNKAPVLTLSSNIESGKINRELTNSVDEDIDRIIEANRTINS